MNSITSLEIPTSLRTISVRSPTLKAFPPQNRGSGPSVFAKPSSERTEDDIREAIRILKEVPFYASLQRDEDEMDKLLTETLDALECRTFNQGDIVFHQTDEVAEFYIIIEGTVDIYAAKTEEEMNDEIFQMENENKIKSSDFSKVPRKSLFVPSIALSGLESDEIIQFHPKKMSNSTRNMRASIGMKTNTITSLLGLQDCFQKHQGQLLFRLKNRRTLGPGTHFGELALANNCNGSITVVAASDLQVASLSKNAFHKICDESQRALHEKIHFFANLMGKAPKDSVARFCFGFKERHYSYGQKVFIQGQLPSEVFIVKQGEVQISRKEGKEQLSPKNGKLSFEKIANVGPYNLIGTGEVSENQPYKMTAISNSYNLVLYVIPIKEFQSLRSSYQDVFERFSDKFRTQLSYFEERAEDVSSINKRVLHLPSLSGVKEAKSPKTLARLRLGQFHDATRSIENKTQLASFSDLRVGFIKESSRVLVTKDKKDKKAPSLSLLAGFHVDSPLYQNSPFNSPTSVRTEKIKQPDPKEKPTFGDCVNYLFTPAEKTRRIRAARLSLRPPQDSQTPRDLNNREFKIGTTLKFLSEHTRLKRNSWNLPAQPSFLMENSPKSIFGKC